MNEEVQTISEALKILGEYIITFGATIKNHPFEFAFLGYIVVRNRKTLGKILARVNGKSERDQVQDEEISEIDQQVYKVSRSLYGDKDTKERGLIEKTLRFQESTEKDIEELKGGQRELKTIFKEHTKIHQGVKEDAVRAAINEVNRIFKDRGM